MRHIKMLIYGEPGVGKSVFACKAPKPFFITTDGNYEWLEDFGAKEEDHIQVNSWEEAKKVFAGDFNGYETIVVDLLEDLFKWDEQEFCKRSKLDHISDIGFGKGYDITRNEFFLEISKLLNKNKNVILICHGITFVTKDRRGVEHTKYAPSSRIPDKVLDMIEGRLRYCLRCYCKADETENGELVKNRYLSLVPKENEFGICRGIDEYKTPHDIPLDWNEFVKALGLTNETTTETNPVSSNTNNNVDETKAEVDDSKNEEENRVDIKEETPVETKVETKVEVKTEIEEKPKVETTEEPKQMSNADKLAAIKAKLAALRANN